MNLEKIGQMILTGVGSYGQSFTGVDTTPALIVQYVPSAGTGGTAATVNCDGTSTITFQVDSAAPAGDDAIGTAGVIDISAAAYDTVQELVNYINSTKAWRAIGCGLSTRSVNTKLLTTGGAQSCIGANGYPLYWDASETDMINAVISLEKFQSNLPGGFAMNQKDMKCILNHFTINAGLTGNGFVRIYYCNDRGVSQLAWSSAATDDTTISLNASGGLTPALVAPTGCRIVLELIGSTSVDDIAQFTVHGQAFSVDGAFVATGTAW